MKDLSKVSKKAAEWVNLSGFNLEKIKENMKGSNSFGIEKLSKKEAEEEGCNSNYPYRLYNPYNLDVN